MVLESNSDTASAEDETMEGGTHPQFPMKPGRGGSKLPPPQKNARGCSPDASVGKMANPQIRDPLGPISITETTPQVGENIGF